MGAVNNEICGSVNCMSILDHYKFDCEEVNQEKDSDIFNFILKKDNKNENKEIIFTNIKYSFKLQNFVRKINKILNQFNRIDDFNLKIIHKSIGLIIDKYIVEKEKKMYLNYLDSFYGIKYKNDDIKQSIKNVCELLEKIYDLKNDIAEDTMSCFIGSIHLLLADTNILEEEKEFFDYLKKIYYVEKKKIQKMNRKKKKILIIMIIIQIIQIIVISMIQLKKNIILF